MKTMTLSLYSSRGAYISWLKNIFQNVEVKYDQKAKKCEPYYRCDRKTSRKDKQQYTKRKKCNQNLSLCFLEHISEV